MELTREIFGNSNSLGDCVHPALSDTQENIDLSQPMRLQSSSSSYTLAYDQSQLSGDVERWIRGSATATETTGIQGSRIPMTQHSTLTANTSYFSTGLWYMLAVILPLFNLNSRTHWRCSPSTILNTAEIFFTHLGRVCSRIRCHVRRIARNQISRELFATAMDIVLVIYAMGFLVLSMYQASIIG